MLRIEQHQDRIVIERWAVSGDSPAKTYPSNPATLAWLSTEIDKAKTQRRVDLFQVTPNRAYAIYLVYPKRHYRVVNGTYFDERTPADLCVLIDGLIRARRETRIKITYGDPFTGLADLENDFETRGYVGRTTGSIKSPLICYNRRSLGGGIISTNRIVRLEYSNKKEGGVLWSHPLYHETAESAQQE